MARTAIGTNDFRSPAIGQPTFVSAVVYRAALACDIWKPAAANRPAIIFLHGGAWAATPQTRNDPVVYLSIARKFAEQGFAVFNADFTSAIAGTRQAPIDDVLALVQWVRDNATTYNADGTRVAAVGISSGGHAAFMAGITGVAGTTRPDAVVGWSGVPDLEASHPIATANIERYMDGLVLLGNEAEYRLYSPVDRVTSTCCPLRIVGSDDEENGTDPGPNVEQYNDLETNALAVGVSVTKRIFSGTLHGIFDGSQGGLNDLPGSCAWIIRTFGEIVPVSTRTVASGRTASSGRVAA